MVGALIDDLAQGKRGVQAQILDDIRFERLEAEGCAEFAVKIEEMQKLFRKDGLSHSGKERT